MYTMNAMPESIIVNSCQYTPVYVIQDPGASQGQSFFIAQSNIEESKPVSDLKAFYESSGNIETSTVNVNSSQKPRILKRPENCVVGNNLKLASFLLPKNENVSKQQYIVNNVILKPNSTINNSSSSVSTVNTVPRLNIDSKIVKLKNIELKTKYNRVERPSPKTKPKEIVQPQNVIPAPAPAPTKHTSVQLLKLGETYHSLNQLSNDQMKMVTQALKIFSNPEKAAPEATYDPVTNTKFIYKVVSPRDLTIVGKNKKVVNKPFETNIICKTQPDVNINDDMKDVLAKEPVKKEIYVKDLGKKIILKTDLKKDSFVKNEVIKKEAVIRRNEEKKQKIHKEMIFEDEPEIVETKVTRSGRKVKLPKPILPEESSHKPKKKNTFVSCSQCSAEFNSLYRLQKHYESHPTHIPAKVHSNLFHCLLAIVKGGTEEDRTNIFVQQLEQLIVKLRSLLPCLLKNEGSEGIPCTINEDVGRLFGMDPGKYNFDVDALNCVKNKDGHCSHSKPPMEQNTEANQNQWVTINNENILTNCETETEDCARINSVEKWPTVSKRVWKLKQQKTENAKRMRMTSESADAHIELGMDNLVTLGASTLPDTDSTILNEECTDNKADHLVNNLECNEAYEVEPASLLAEDANLQPPEGICLQPEQETSFLDADPVSLLSSDPIASIKPIMEETKQHPQFHSAHFDIRSSPIKPSSTVFRKFQINPEILAKYEADTIRSIETVNKTQETMAETSQESTSNVLSNKETMQFDNDDKCPLSHKDTLQEIFKDEDIAVVKESFILDKDLKDWILNRSDDKSEDGFSKSSSLIEPALVCVNNHEMKVSLNNEIEQKVDLPTSDSHDESSVLNFLDSLASDCLSYPGTEIRTNNGDFQMDLFSFHSS